MHNTIFDNTTAGLHCCHPGKFCCCSFAHHLAASCAVTRVLLKCIQQLLCSQHLSLVIVLGEAPLHIHGDELANAHELASHNSFIVCEFHALLVLSVGGENTRDAASLHNSPYFGGSNCSPITTGVAASRPSCRAMSTRIQSFSERLLPCFSCASSSQPERSPLLYASSSSHSEQRPNLL